MDGRPTAAELQVAPRTVDGFAAFRPGTRSNTDSFADVLGGALDLAPLRG